jgi:hypothetical protein
MEHALAKVNEGFDGGSCFRHKARAMPARGAQLTPLQRRRLIGRRVGTAVFGLLFASATLVWSLEILSAVWGSAPPSPDGCARGTESLERAIERARSAYALGAGDEDERTALSRFRSALEPEWAQRKAVEAACKGDRVAEKHLRDVVALRYAEEHAVRYESLDLAPLRRRIHGTRKSPN